MSNNTESTSNSIRFAPMPVSVLLANLKPLQQQSDTPDSSFTTDESDDSIEEMNIKKTLQPKKPFQISTPRNYNQQDFKSFASENKNFSDHNKENVDKNKVSNQIYPSNEFNPFLSASRNTKTITSHPNSEKTPNVIEAKINNIKSSQGLLSAYKNTPESKVPNSNQKSKIVTPKIKSGIRRFTPGSHRQSHKKAPLPTVLHNRDKVRCELFKQSQQKVEQTPTEPTPTPLATLAPMPAPETPINRQPLPASYVATPSYPQGVVGNNSKMLFKTTCIKDKKYIVIKKLGTGGSSEVFKVLEVGTSLEYAVKRVHLTNDNEMAQSYINEVRLLRELQNSDRVIRLYDYEYDRPNQQLRLVMEVGETDLSSFLRARGGCLPPVLVLHYWEEMLHAVNYIHNHGVIHADLKPANFLLVCGRLKLIDFGIASAISGDATSVVRSQAAGTYSYISPEALMGGAGGYGAAAPIKISFRSDVWSLGCILYSMVYGRTPFGHIQNFAKLTAILDPNHQIDYPPADHVPQSLISSLRWCLTYNARARPSVRELLAARHLAASPAAPLPAPLLERLRPHVSSDEYALLQRART